MIDVLRTEWPKPHTARWWLAGIIASAALTAAFAFLGGLAISSVVFPIHDHVLQANGTAFYPLGTERGPHIQLGSLILLIGAGSFLVALGLTVLCLWALLTLALAKMLTRRSNA